MYGLIEQPAPLTNRLNMPSLLVAGQNSNPVLHSLAMAVTKASTHFAYPRKDGQAEFAWMGGYVAIWFT